MIVSVKMSTLHDIGVESSVGMQQPRTRLNVEKVVWLSSRSAQVRATLARILEIVASVNGAKLDKISLHSCASAVTPQPNSPIRSPTEISLSISAKIASNSVSKSMHLQHKRKALERVRSWTYGVKRGGQPKSGTLKHQLREAVEKG